MTDVRKGGVLRWLRTLIDAGASGDLSDDDLLGRYVSGRDEAAFEAIVRRHGPLVLGVCRRLLFNSQDVEDAFQAVFLILVRKAASIRRRERLAAWLFGVAHRVAMRSRAQAARRGRSLVCDVPAADPPSDALWQEVRQVIDEEVRRLPARYRLPVVLCYLQGLTNEEAARALGCPKGTVATLLARARDRLRTRLARRGVAPSAGLVGAALLRYAGPAAVPESLVRAAVTAAARVAAGGAVAATVSAPTAALVKGVLRDMFWSQIRAIAAVALALALAAGSGWLVRRALTAETPPAPAAPGGAKGEAAAEGPKDGRAPDGDKPAPAWQAKGNMQVGDGEVKVLGVSPDGKTVSVVLLPTNPPPNMNGPGGLIDSMAVKLWDADGGRRRATVTDPRRLLLSDVYAVAYSPDGRTMATAELGLVLWDADKGKLRRELPVEPTTYSAVAFSPDGKTVAGVRADGVVRVYNAETGRERFAARGHKTGGPSAAFTADGKTLATADFDGTVKLWDVARGGVQATYHCKGAGPPVFSPDGKAAAADAGGGAIQVWDLATGKPCTTLTGPARDVEQLQLAFSPDGSTLAAGGLDGTLTLWDLTAEKELTTLKGHKDAITRLAFSADGKTLASGDQKGKVLIWSLAAQSSAK
jgi:RNA polymerase sigma factor (sigma-70 family)